MAPKVCFTRDLWKAYPGRRGRGKRWLSVWHDDDGAERSRAFAIKDAAKKHWQAMETDRARGEYVDPKAGRELLGRIGRRWLASRNGAPVDHQAQRAVAASAHLSSWRAITMRWIWFVPSYIWVILASRIMRSTG
jgi:hypothetical protein